MLILVVAATAAEVAPLVNALQRVEQREPCTRYTGRGHDIDVLVTGVGMVATATWCSRVLVRQRYDLALNLGVCGSFDPSLVPGTVVHVLSDCFPELGAEDGDGFLSIDDLGLLGDERLYRDGRLINQAPPANAALAALRSVEGITVNTVHGNAESIARVVSRVAPHVESMEGAAFMYACLADGLPFAQIRAVSNMVERRNRAAWKLPQAIASLTDATLRIFEHA